MAGNFTTLTTQFMAPVAAGGWILRVRKISHARLPLSPSFDSKNQFVFHALPRFDRTNVCWMGFRTCDRHCTSILPKSLSLLFLYFCSDLRLTFYCTCMIRDILRLKCNNIHLRLLVVPIPSSSSTCHPFAVRKTHVSSRPKPRPTSAGSWDCENG